MPSLAGKRLGATPFVEVELDIVRRIAVIRRTDAPFRRADEIDAAIELIRRVLPTVQRADLGALIDTREAPVRVDPALSPAFARYRMETERGFARVAVVVRTTLGRIQSGRLRAETRSDLGIFEELDDALAYLRERQ